MHSSILKVMQTTLAIASVAGVTVFTIASKANAAAFVSLTNGDFETGSLTPGWTASGVNDGFALVVREGTQFSVFNTTGIILNGDFAVNVRSSGPAPTNSVGILTSAPFVIGDQLRFSALSEAQGQVDPVNLIVDLLDENSQILFSEVVKTNLINVSDVPTNGIFSNHLLDTSRFAGQTVALQFRQNTQVQGSGYFTLIDNVETTVPESVPEPASAAGVVLFGMAGVGRWLKRSKTQL